MSIAGRRVDVSVGERGGLLDQRVDVPRLTVVVILSGGKIAVDRFLPLMSE